ncbi:hypothetical protein CW751_13915 [Brumimicrobium salinarum]|uniref:LysM domain-containing protein n=1 Tax=Brumimicrobium salinarum TaxID=2058658 RepID=A0A2I0QZV3_9FLAO|nr:hypothetical protein CW751_13915 [Brumimicrobium salinarum]
MRSGENLWVIAKQRGISIDEIKKLNPGVNYRDLKVGQKIRVK